MDEDGPGHHETYHGRALYRLCSSEPASVFQGTPYPCTQSDLDDLAILPNNAPHRFRWSERATLELERILAPNASISIEVQDAVARLREALNIDDWTPDIVIKAFHDLDLVFFDGKLRGVTTIDWQSARWWNEEIKSIYGYRFCFGQAVYLGNRKTAIHLNAWGILLDTTDAKVAMWAVVLHEMTHAYEQVICGLLCPTPYEQSRGWLDRHGLMFRRLIHCVHQRSMQLLNMPAIIPEILGDLEDYAL